MSQLKPIQITFLLLLGFILLPWRASAQETSVTFITNAFAAVGISLSSPSTNPVTCAWASLANDHLFAIGTGAPRVAEATRLVSLLFETPGSFDGLVSYTESETYAVRNTQSRHQDTVFVQDLYAAFLQRPPDSSGMTYWLNTVATSGRAAVLADFPNHPEFATLVNSLAAGKLCCPVGCPAGLTFNLNACACQ